MYVYMCMCMYVCVYMRAYVCVYVCMYMRVLGHEQILQHSNVCSF